MSLFVFAIPAWLFVGILTFWFILLVIKAAEKNLEDGDTSLIPTMAKLYSNLEIIGMSGLLFLCILVWPYFWYEIFFKRK